jgi:hypothetical protein
MAGRRINKSRAGLQSAVMAVLLVIIAIALASIVWLFASTQTQSLARSAKIDIIDAKYLLGATPIAMVTVKNTGSVAVTINSVTIPGVTSCNFGTISQTLNPGETAAFVASAGCPSLSPGAKLTIIVEGKGTATNEPVKAVGQVVVM